MPIPIIIAGFELFPEPFTVTPFRIGSTKPRRSLRGKGFQKIVRELRRLPIAWEAADEDEMQIIRILWTRSKDAPLAVACTDPAVQGNFFITDEEFNFTRLDGDGHFYRGSLTLEEEG